MNFVVPVALAFLFEIAVQGEANDANEYQAGPNFVERFSDDPEYGDRA